MRTLLQGGNDRRRTRLAILAGCAVALLLLALVEVVGENGYLDRRARRQQLQALAGEIEKLKQENQGLTQKVKALRSDPHAIEELAREELRLGRPGEVIVTIPRSQPPAPPLPPAQPQ